MREKKGRVFSQNKDAGAESNAEATPRKSNKGPREVGVTEARLRAANKESWLGTKKGWSSFFKRLVP